jgi:hypothetical protein
MGWKQDLMSKIFDGVLAAVILYLLLSFATLLVGPVQASFGRPGLLIYCLTLIAVSVYCLEHSLLTRIPDSYRAWYGMIGGISAWAAISLSNSLGALRITNVTSVLVLILVSLTVTRLWRRHLPLGARFYSLTFLTAWTGQLILEGQPQLAAWQPVTGSVYQGAAYAAIVAAIGIVWWIFTRTDRRIERLNLAPALAFCVTLAVFILVAASPG